MDAGKRGGRDWAAFPAFALRVEPQVRLAASRINRGRKVSPHETHNRLAPELVKRLISETEGESDAMVVLESVMLGVMLYYRPKPREAGEFMDSMTEAVIKRLGT